MGRRLLLSNIWLNCYFLGAQMDYDHSIILIRQRRVTFDGIPHFFTCGLVGWDIRARGWRFLHVLSEPQR